jgi:hypothetical protein
MQSPVPVDSPTGGGSELEDHAHSQLLSVLPHLRQRECLAPVDGDAVHNKPGAQDVNVNVLQNAFFGMGLCAEHCVSLPLNLRRLVAGGMRCLAGLTDLPRPLSGQRR